MANEDIKYFNVKNISVRLVHIGGVAVPPEKVVPIVDDENGINRLDVESSEYLEASDEEVSQGFEIAEEVKPVAKKAKASKNTAAPGDADKAPADKAPTATGAGWNANKQ